MASWKKNMFKKESEMAKTMNTQEFLDDVPESSGDILDWRKDGKVTVFIHSVGFVGRRSVWFPQLVETKKKGKKKISVEDTHVVLPPEDKCPLKEFLDYLKENDDIENDDVVFDLDGHYEVLKGDALNVREYAWKKSLKPSKEHIMAVVDTHNVEAGLQIVIAKPGLSRSIKRVISDKMDDLEESGKDKDLGDPILNPYAFRFKYEEDETPNNMYSASESSQEMTDEIKELLDSDPPDFSGLLQATSRKEMIAMIEEGNTTEFSFSEVEEKEEKEEKKAKTSVKKGKGKKEKEDKDEEKPKKGKKEKKVKQVKKVKEESKEEEPKEETDICPACDKVIPASAKQCPHAGCLVEYAEDNDEESSNDSEESSDKIKCPHCDEEIESGTKRCGECGEKI